jgi:dephospho-CoA kinase
VVVAGLTGGIATGKSTVAAIFEEAGARLIDADRIAREAVRKDAPAYREIVAHFGPEVLRENGELDRKRLAAVIFGDPDEQRALERIVHPRVRQAIDLGIEQLRRQAPDALLIVDIPLLFEAGMQHGLDAVIVVYAPEDLQAERLMARDGLTRPEAVARIRAQMPIESKRALATYLIDNSGSMARTRAETLEVYRRLTSTAQRAGG